MAVTTDNPAGLILPSLMQSANARLLLMMGGAAAIVALMAAVWFWGQKPEYRVLFANYSDRDGGAIVAALQQMNVPYQVADGGGAIMVPALQVHEVRLKLASQGLPKGSGVGFELMENQKLGISQFLEQVNFQRALEGELARTIQALANVQAARVHLAMPKATVFLREQQKPTASVLLNLHPGRALEAQQVSAIVHLVAASVPELPVVNVTVVDQNGNLLSDTSKPKGANQLDPTQLKYVEDMQQSIARRIESIITPIVGAANVRAEVSAEIDFSTSEQAAETYKPNQTPENTVIRSQHQSETQSTGSATASGVPGALSNQPPPNATAPVTKPQGAPNAPAAPAAANATPPGNRSKDSTVNYEVDKTLKITQQPMGGIKRLSVAVVVNHKQEAGKDGKPRNRALTDEEKASITDLVKEAMGYNKDRGDTLNVVNSAFAHAAPQPAEELPIWKQPENISLAKDAGRYLLMAGVIAWLYVTQLKPLLARMRAPVQITTVTHAEPLLGEPQALPSAAGGARVSDLDNARQVARDDPRMVANVVKNWVGAE
ncbi:MAG: flagellar basal body M-ring protein FliF [Pseudomonadota bacterium]